MVLRFIAVFCFTLISQSQSVDIFCEFGYPYEWVNIGNVYTCTVKNMSISIANENVTNIIGTHEPGKTNRDVAKLNIPKPNRCSFFPKGFEKFFPNLTGLRVAQAGLVSLTHDDLQVFPKLRNCDMFNNNLRTLSSDLFESTPDVDYLYFGDNRLTEIGYDIFKPLKKLKFAVFQGNNCIRTNADLITEIPALQDEMNQNCATATYNEVKALEEAMKEEEEENRRLKEHLEMQRNDSSSTFTIWLFAIFVVIGALSTVYYFARLKRGNPTDSESVTNFCNKYNEMTNEVTSPYDNVHSGGIVQSV